jgi:membrane protease YdiL (CAAX protease family)
MVLAVGGAVWIGFREGVIPLRLFFDVREWWLDLLLGVGAGLLLLGLWKGAESGSPLARELEGLLGEALGPLGRTEVIALAVLSGFAEELFFRGAVQGSFGWLPATVLFALLHTGPGRAFRLWTLFALVAGLLFGGLMELRGNLLGPVVAHFLVNAVNLWRLASRDESGRLARRGSTEGEKES